MSEPGSLTERGLELLEERRLPDGGFRQRPRGPFGVDATAWAVLAMAGLRRADGSVRLARKRLERCQLSDGRVPISPDFPVAYWPTPVAAMAWRGSSEHGDNRERAIRFLLSARGRHFARMEGGPVAHDTALEGWPWTEDAHSMVEPTATALMALRMDGARDREREVQAVRMLLDRQLAGGGWNYGNTAVYGSQLDPLPDATGLALAALAGRVPAERVGASLAYLRDRCRDVRTPLSLGWICLGLAAWGRRVSEGRARIAECLDRERKRDSCATADLAILVLAGRSAETPLVENLRWGRKE